MLKPKVLLILPLFNEVKRINSVEYLDAFKTYNYFDFLLIDDCSKDETFSIITVLSGPFDNVSCLRNNENKGKAESIRLGVLSSDLSKYNYIGYLDADLAVPFSEMKYLFDAAVQNKQKLFVMGSRIKLINNNIKRSMLRHYTGRIFASIVSMIIIKTPVYDTQCGAKIIEAQLAKKLFEDPFDTKWLFDVELLLRYKKIDINFIEHIMEVPLNNWIEKGKTKIKFYEFLSVPFHLIKLSFKYV